MRPTLRPTRIILNARKAETGDSQLNSEVEDARGFI
jgi:hypothetical protein